MLNKRTNGRTKNYNHCLLPFFLLFNIIIIASPLLKEWKLKKLIGRDGVIIKENQTQKTKGVWVRLNEPFANELEWFIPIQSVQITSH